MSRAPQCTRDAQPYPLWLVNYLSFGICTAGGRFTAFDELPESVNNFLRRCKQHLSFCGKIKNQMTAKRQWCGGII